MEIVGKQFKHLNRDTKNGRARVRFKHPNGAPKVTLHAPEGTPEFAAEYSAAMAAAVAWVPPTHKVEKVDPKAGRDPRTLDWLVERYMAHTDFTEGYNRSTQRARKNVLLNICNSLHNGHRRGVLPFADMRASHVEVMRDEKLNQEIAGCGVRKRRAKTPEAANARAKTLRALFAWAKGGTRKYVTANPCDGVALLPPLNEDGFYTWTTDDLAKFERFYPVGTMARRAVATFVYSGLRRSDACRVGKAMERKGHDEHGNAFTYLHVEPMKGSRSKHRKPPAPVDIPILPELAEVLAVPVKEGDHLVYLVTEFGKPFTAAGLGNRMRKCDAPAWTFSARPAQAGARAIKNGASVGQPGDLRMARSQDRSAPHREIDRQDASFKGVHLLRPRRQARTRRNGKLPTSPTSRKALFHCF